MECLKNTTLKKGFMYEKYILNLEATMKAVWDRFEKSGRIQAFECKWKDGDEKQPHIYWDSDVAKWMEAAAYILGKKKDEDLKSKVEGLIDQIEKNQGEDGYFNIYFTVCESENRFTKQEAHELYCAGHLIEAACAYFETCGDERFLKLMEKYVDYIYQVFVTEKSAVFSTPGHEEISLALIRLYNITKKHKYLDLCKYFINTRGTENDKCQDIEGCRFDENRLLNMQSHKPVREQKEAVGHCVRLLYLYCAVADLAKQINDSELFAACDAIFENIINYKMYITGGLGQNHDGEGFTERYDLKNDTAYAETCASIAMMMFCERMFELRHSSIYADIIEREFYNGMLSGISLDGKAFFYTNPLEIDLNRHKSVDMCLYRNANWLPITQRVEIFSCSCCPPNLCRTLASLERFIYYVENDDVYINQFAESEYNNGKIQVSIQTDYPQTGVVKVKAQGTKNIFVRIPSWCESFSVSSSYEKIDGYIKVLADEFEICFDMPVEYIMSNENVVENANKIAIMRGPIVYCAEKADNNVQPYKLYINKDGNATTQMDDYFGVPTLSLDGYIRKTELPLYTKLNENFQNTKIKLIPYFGFANRGEDDMAVWLNYR